MKPLRMPVAAPRNSAMTFRIEAFVVCSMLYSAAFVVVVAVEHSIMSFCCGVCGEPQAQRCVMIASSDFKQMMGFR